MVDTSHFICFESLAGDCCGRLEKIVGPVDKISRKTRGFASARYRTEDQALWVIWRINDKSLR